MKKVLLYLSCIILPACNKFLQKPADSAQTPPTTLDGYALLLENDLMTVRVTPNASSLCTDDFALSRNNTSNPYWGLYTWNPSLYQASGVTDNAWNNPYKAISYANVAIAGLPGLPAAERARIQEYNRVYGSSYFYRALHYFFLEENFGYPFDSRSAGTDKGVVLRLSADAEERPGRSTVAEVYDQIIRDLAIAIRLLPRTVQRDHINRPSLPAAYALLARVWMVRREYSVAQAYADSCLLLTDSLIRYDTISGVKAHPFDAVGNSEVLFQCSGSDYPPLYASTTAIDADLYASYDVDDLRRSLFFQLMPAGEGVSFKGYYSIGHLTFSGCALDEVYLIRAECKARNNDVQGAMADLNKLLRTRWRPGTFHDYQATTSEMALALILRERRKELVGRELRFIDLRRLKDGPFAVTLHRGSGDSLAPTGAGYTLLIPNKEISLGGITQN